MRHVSEEGTEMPINYRLRGFLLDLGLILNYYNYIFTKISYQMNRRNNNEVPLLRK